MDEQTDTEKTLRTIVEEADSGAPAVGSKVRDRFGTNEIYQRRLLTATTNCPQETGSCFSARSLVASPSV